MKAPAPPLRPHMLKSLALHGLAVLVICAALYQAHKSIEEQELAFLEDIKAQEEALEESERAETEELLEEELAAQIEEEFEAILDQELSEELAEQMQEQLSEQLEEWIDEATQDQTLQEMTPEQLAALSESLREMSMKELQEQLNEMKKDMLLSMVREKIEKEVAPDIKRNIEKELKSNTGKELKEQLQKKAQEEKRERLEDLRKELGEAKKELTELKKEQAQVNAQAKKDKTAEAKEQQDAVDKKLEQVKEKISDTLEDVAKIAKDNTDTNSLRNKLEQVKKEVDESKKALNEQNKNQQIKETQDVVKEIDQASREIDKLNNQLKQQERSRELTDIDKQAIDDVLPEIEQLAREQVTKAVTEESVPLAAEKLSKALETQLEKLQLNNDEFKKALEQEINDALNKDLKKQQPDSQTASMQSKEMIERRSAEEIKEARESIKKALDKLETANKKQEDLKRDTIRETASKDAQDEMDIRQEIKDAQADASQALDEASAVTLKNDNAIKNAKKDLANDKAVNKAKEASTFVKQEIVEEAKKAMQEVNDELNKKINKLKEVDSGLAKEQEALEKMEIAKLELAELLGTEASEALQEEMKKAGEELLSKETSKDVKSATEKTKIDDSLDGMEMLESMQELSEGMAELAGDGRMMDGAGELMGEMEAGLLGPGQGQGGTLPGNGGQRFPGAVRGYGHFNRALYEEFAKDMRDRLNPKKAYEEQEEQEGLHSTTEKRETEAVASMVVLKGQGAQAEEPEKKVERKVPDPEFHTVAFGAADYAIDPITIDGDLSDWGELRHPQKHKFDKDGSAIEGIDVYMRWSPQGLYFCYTVKDTRPINNNGPAMWQVTGMELFVDVRNRRKANMEDSPTAQQIFFCPFGWAKNPNMTFGESGRGHRGLMWFKGYPDSQGLRGKSAHKIIPGGYQVECLIKRTSLGHPMLAPGMYMAINHSVNIGDSNETQWSAPKSVQTWNKPDTWGDVLLLGSDARVKFKHFEDNDLELKGVLPGDPVRVEITDPDMNLLDIKADRIMATVKVDKTDTPVMLVLKETKANSGVFAGSFATQSYFMPAKANTLNIRGGGSIILSYNDARSGYGEKNRKITAKLAVGWPVTELGQ